MRKITILFSTLVAFCTLATAQETSNDAIVVATMEDVELPDCGYNVLMDGSMDEGDYVQSGSFVFDINTLSDWITWWGYATSNRTETSFKTTDPDQYNSCVGKGYNDSKNYGVAYVASFMGPTYITLSTDNAATVNGLYVTNSAWAFSSLLNGDSYAKKFGAGDWFKITATGFDDEQNVVGTKDFYLADFRSANDDDWYIVNDWTYMDLSTLGNVRQISFSVNSSDVGVNGMNTPAYFCFDDLGAEGVETTYAGNWKSLTASVTDPTSVSDEDVEIKSVDYYNLEGQHLNAPQKGINIKKTTYTNGKLKTTKELH